jgi:hypothetical protein
MDFSYLGNGLVGIYIDIKRSYVSYMSDKFLFHPPRNAMTHPDNMELTAKPTPFFEVSLIIFRGSINLYITFILH